MSVSMDNTEVMHGTSDRFSSSIVSAVRAEMGRQGKKLNELVAPLGLSWPTISSRLNGHTEFTMSELDKVASFLGINAYDLIDSAALGERFADKTVVAEALPAAPRDVFAQPARSKTRRAS